ncbi:lysostaphin resistance A-like protein [Pseudomonas aeruginosa]|jgi:membrane protease YdiL (CAAX protease family)|uniref:CPBP family intramembrane glutamic endopeptidase n=1 Tax=Pseudomonas aeruginosa TaxID=287 RepID=UPI001A31AEC6|nr:type II CAAX endopeptidase family protein [Pseudomonas aeruginosa]MBH4318544.1 CPBP family intramembrane metalloprotease [Pseudomonas aeruginosa]MBH8701101.1 CPBP family intramembrane metalloprotease [Pseudomonas aeruginosa]WBM10788.1 CPBP family intramembrane metalloprotease [Pseudomonas aeruginosa]HEK3610413.1 CPBP family intramembrane metalloprotease [Pseudomonas aeruginosa]
MPNETSFFTGTPNGWLIQPWKLLASAAWIAVAMVVGYLAFKAGAGAYGMFFSHLAGALFIGLCYVLTTRFGSAGRFVGQFNGKDVGIAVGAMATIYIAALIIQKAFDIPQEPLMASLFQDRSMLEVCSILITVLVLAPVGEELAMRHYFLGILDWRRSVVVATSAVILSAGAFTLLHISQYENTLTLYVMFAVGLVAGYLRVRSNGLALPIIAHGSAGGIALIVNQFL